MISVREFLAQRPSGPLYHYTDATGLLGIIERKEMWASNPLHLNDAKELRQAIDLLGVEMRKRLDASGHGPKLSPEMTTLHQTLDTEFQKAAGELLVASFSVNPNQLSQWRSYCGNGDGFSIGFEHSELSHALRVSNFLLVKCVYDPTEQAELIRIVVDYLERGFRKSQSKMLKRGWSLQDCGFRLRVTKKALAVMLALKHEGFMEEQEWRLVGSSSDAVPVRFRPGRFGIIPYCGLPLCPPEQKPRIARIYVGPNAEPDLAKAAVEELVRLYTEYGATARTEVVGSEIPYRVG